MTNKDILDKFEELSYQWLDEAKLCEDNIKHIDANHWIAQRWQNRAELWREVSLYLRNFVKDIRKNIE